MSKIQYIRDNDVSDLELVFVEEEFSDDGSVKVHWGGEGERDKNY